MFTRLSFCPILQIVFGKTKIKIDLTAPDAGVFEPEIYEMKNVGVKAVIYSVETDGPVSWNITGGTVKCSVAVFVHEGIEYVYMGGMNHDTMKQFLDMLD